MSYKLRACPMCGGNEIDVRTRKVTIIECKSCGLMMFDRRDGVERNAIAAWNRRADDRKPITTDPCNGMNCGCTDGVSHSPECLAQTAATYAGGYFVKAGVVVDDLDIPGLKCAAQAMTPIMRNWIMRVLDAFESASAAPQPAPAPIDESALTASIWQRICELPDRNSPEDEPDACVLNRREFEGCVAGALEDLNLLSPQGVSAQPAPATGDEREAFELHYGRTEREEILLLRKDVQQLQSRNDELSHELATASAAHRRGNEWQASTPEQLGELLDKIAPPTDEREAFKKCMRAFGIASDDYHAWVGWQTSAHHRRDAYSVPLVRYRINLADGTDSADPDGGYFRDTDVAAMMARNELHMDQVMRERDGVHDKADQLADAIAEYLGVEIGEHSNLNCPWTNALEHIGAAHRREDQRDAERWRLAAITWRIFHVEVAPGVTLSHRKGVPFDDLTTQIDAAMQRTAAPAHGENGGMSEGGEG